MPAVKQNLSESASETGLANMSGIKRINSNRTRLRSLPGETPQKIASLCESLTLNAHITSPAQRSKVKSQCTKTPKINTFFSITNPVTLNEGVQSQFSSTQPMQIDSGSNSDNIVNTHDSFRNTVRNEAAEQAVAELGQAQHSFAIVPGK